VKARPAMPNGSARARTRNSRSGPRAVTRR
jgi:hypothetical protein